MHRPARTLVLAAFLVTLGGAASHAQAAPADTSLAERLRALEERVAALEAENARLKAGAAPPEAVPPPKAAAPVVATAAGKEKDLKVGGLLQLQGEVGGSGDTRFSDDHDRVFLRRARVNVSGRFLDEVEWRTEIELAGTLANSSSLRGQLTDAYLAWKPTKAFELRGGQFKTPFGHEHLFSDSRLAFSERTLGSDRLTLGRQAGVMLSGSPWEQRLTWSAGAFGGTPANSSGNDDDRFLLAGRLAGRAATWTVAEVEGSWSLGAGAYASDDRAIGMAGDFRFDSDPGQPGRDNVFEGRRSAWGLDTQVAHGPVEVWAEWLEAAFRPADDLPAGEVDSRARTVQAAWLTLEKRLQLAARWDEFDPVRETSGDSTRTWTAGASWLVRGHDLKLQAHWMDVHGPQPRGHEGKLLLRVQLAF